VITNHENIFVRVRWISVCGFSFIPYHLTFGIKISDLHDLPGNSLLLTLDITNCKKNIVGLTMDNEV